MAVVFPQSRRWLRKPLGGCHARRKVSMKLSHAQRSAYLKLSPMVWKSAYDVRASMATMEALVKKGWAESKGHGSLGSMYSPRTTVMYRAIRPTKHAPDVVESAASVSISPASEVSASEAESKPATTQVM